ncbi:FG-GAP-like repeat-containing protein [Streptomyces sp. NPDC003300]|uniref:FG-GAP-like repeat-containing protein n=1 Tax=unclassified Streptomyces TaxID=2593676 RepID=UPI0033BD08B4
MAKRTLVRGGVAVAISLALAAGAAPFAGVGPAAAAEPAPYDVVVPPVNKPVLAEEWVVSSGATGYLRVFGGVDQWVPYGTGAPRTLGSGGTNLVLLPGGAERYASTNLRKGVRLLDPAAGTAVDFALPPGHTYRSAIGTPDGWAVITTTDDTDGTTVTGQTVHLLTVAGDATAFTERPLTGLPTGATYTATLLRGERATRVVVATTVAGQMSLSVLDLTTGAVVRTMEPPAGVPKFSNTRSFGWYSAGVLTYYSLDDPQAAPRTVALPPEAHADTTTYAVTLSDTALLAVRKGSVWNDGRADPLYSVPLDGGPVTQPLPVAAAPTASQDGGTVVSGGADSDHWNSYRFAPSGAAPVTLFHHEVEKPVRYGLALARGRLSFMEGMPDWTGAVPGARFYAQDEGTGAVPQPVTGPPHTVVEPSPVSTCGAPGHCAVSLVAGSEGQGTAYIRDGADGVGGVGGDVVDVMSGGGFYGVQVAVTGGRIVDASERFTLYNGGSNGRQYVISPGYRKVVISRPTVPAALWGDILWSATAAKGQLTSTDLRSNDSTGPAAPSSLTTDAPCAIKEVQALGRLLYWSCGANGPAGVYDRTAKKSVAVPAGPALLGDGFVIRHSGDQLTLTDVRSGTSGAGKTRVVAALPADPKAPGGDRGLSWTVDKYRGGIAYTAPDASIHLISAGIAPSALNALWSQVDLPVRPRQANSRWQGWWVLSGATSGWKIDFRNAATGALFATVTGGAARAEVFANWDGKNAKGAYAPDGTYRWTLTATPANGLSPGTTASGMVGVARSSPNHHALTSGADGGVVGLTPGGVLRLYVGNGSGGLSSPRTADHGWPTTATYLAFDDLDENGCGNLLVRTSDGQLRSYPGGCEGSFLRSQPSKLIGSGWNIYNSLLSPGDLTGDGRSDLLARTPGGDLYLYADNGAGSFRTRVKIGDGFGIFSAIVGTGDLTGDGVGDIVARDTSGVLWRYDGDGTGGLKARVRIGSGWNTYNVLVGPGDLNRDGRADLLARDAAGGLWRYAATANGQFGARVRVGTGWTGYGRLF